MATSSRGLNNLDKTHLALVAPTTVIGVRPAPLQEMPPQTSQLLCPVSYVTEISNSFG
jgi:hypothetical protein